MTKAAHTQGPWKCCPASVHRPEIITAHNKVICSVWSGGSVSQITYDEWQANIHLIASAPDLLEALEAVIDLQDADSVFATPILAQARAAIAKAKGGAA